MARLSSGSTGWVVGLVAVAMSIGVPQAWAQKPLGIDVSYWQGPLSQTNWNSVYSAGKRFAFIRATHWTASGETYAYGDPDPYFANNIVRARTAGLLAGAYDFARPSKRSPTTDAAYFLTYASPYITQGYLRPVLDLEEAGGTTPVGATSLSAWANAWLDYVEQQTGVEGIVYCNSNYARNYLNSTLASRTLWIANYSCSSNPQTANPPAGIGIWPTWNFWQYCSTGTVSGISGNVDLDVFNGTLSQLQAYVIGAGAPPVISNVQATNVTTSSATITWTTDSAATSQVFYGMTSAYGSQSPLYSTQVTSHSVTLTGLQSGVIYHYQAVSTNGYGTAASTDRTFTTSSSGSEVVVDNTDPGCTVTGSWTVGTSSTHVGSNYIWTYGCGRTSESYATAKIRWTPYLTSGRYDVYAYYAAGSNRSTYTYWKIRNAGSIVTVRLNEQLPGNAYTLVASNIPFNTGTGGYVELMNNTGDSAVVQGDAVKFVYRGPR